MKSYRREKFLQIVDSKPFVSFAELCEAFPDVSEMTIRRDVEDYEKEGLLIRVRAGVRSMKHISNTVERGFKARLGMNPELKEGLAKVAAERFTDGSFAYLDSGTTAYAVAKEIGNKRISVMTPGLNVAEEMLKKDLIVVNIVGGIVNRDNLMSAGDSAVSHVSRYNFDMAMIMPAGVTEEGLLCGNHSFNDLKKAVIKKAKKVIVVFDSSKIGWALPYCFSDFSDIDEIITDRPFPSSYTEKLEKAGVEVTVVEIKN